MFEVEKKYREAEAGAKPAPAKKSRGAGKKVAAKT
jgi:hypothetical protein